MPEGYSSDDELGFEMEDVKPEEEKKEEVKAVSAPVTIPVREGDWTRRYAEENNKEAKKLSRSAPENFAEWLGTEKIDDMDLLGTSFNTCMSLTERIKYQSKTPAVNVFGKQ